jgi:hypothetical protein
MKWIAVALLGLTASAYGQSSGPSAGALLGASFESLNYPTEASMAMDFATVGGFADFTYVEASLVLLVQMGLQSSHLALQGQPEDDRSIDSRFVNLAGRVLLKYPLPFLRSLSLFPLLGLEYSQNLTYLNKEPFLKDSELNDLFLDAGAGLDIPLSDRAYLRAEGLYGLNLTPTSQIIKDNVSANGGYYSDYGYRLNVSLGIGTRF